MALPLKIEHPIGVRPPAPGIWEKIADIIGWPAWNPLYPKAKGEIQFGSELELEVALPGQPPRAIKQKIRDWTPNEQIIWDLSMLAPASSPTARSSTVR